MKKITLLFILALVSRLTVAQDIFISKNANASFFSSTVVEDIEAKTNTGASVINVKSGEIFFTISNASFRFPKKLMEEHFNENYIESEKFPNSAFKGKITGNYTPGKNGIYQVSVTGNLLIHGISRPVTVPAELTVNDGNISAKTSFKVKIADYGIKVPSLVFKNIAEFIEIKIQALYLPKP